MMPNAQDKPHVERMAEHPQSPSAKWQKFLADQADSVQRSAEARAATSREEHDGTQYTRSQRGETEGT